MRNSYLILLMLLMPACLNKAPGEKEAIPESGSIVVNGNKLNYVVEGEGIPCLVIGSSVYYPRTFSDSLKLSLKMYFIDLPWFSKKPASIKLDEYGINNIADEIEEARKGLQLAKPIIIGHSIHGTIAYEYAKRYPEKISGIVMIGSPNIYGNDEYIRATEEIWSTASEERKEKQNRNWIMLAESGTSNKEGETIREYLAMAPVYWYNPDYDASWLWADMTVNEEIIDHIYETVFNDYRMFNSINNIPAPTLVVTGKYDYAVPYTLWQDFDSVTGLTVRLFNESGHTPQLEQSNEFNSTLLDWMGENFEY